MKGACCALVAAALTCTPVAAAHRLVSVGYRAPSALHGLRVVQRVDALRVAEVRVASDGAAARLRSRPGIRFVHRVVARGQAGASPLAALGATAPANWQWTAAHVDLVPPWVLDAASAVTIAVVDTGADLTVPALAAEHAVTWNVTDGSADVRDAVGHGTFVASLAAGTIGFGGRAQLMVVQANRGGTSFTDLDEANGIVWAVDHGANIVNLSIGGTETSDVERSAIRYALDRGVLLVAAAGNTAGQGNPVTYPAALVGRSGLVVGAADQAGHRAGFSTTGAYVDLLAPGVDVLGALATGVTGTFFTSTPTPGMDGAYGVGSGTSYAAPEVAGAAALVMAANPTLDAAHVAQMLEATASGDGVWTRSAAYGNLDVAAAVQHALGGPAPALLPPVAMKPSAAKPRKVAKTAPAGKKRPKPERPR